MNRALSRRTIVPLLLLLFAGCTDDGGPRRYPVSGTVTFDKQPVADGEIRFISEDGKSYTEGAKILQGRFSGSVTGGPKRIEIRAAREDPTRMVPAGNDPGNFEPDMVQYIPPHYNDKSTLTAEVSPDKKNEYTFELRSDPPGRRKK